MKSLLQGSYGARDYCVQQDVSALIWGRTYYYRFRALGALSPVGRTRIARRGMIPDTWKCGLSITSGR